MPDRLEVIFKTMVAKKIEDRYQTMTAVIADLEGCGGGQTVNLPSFAESDMGLTNFLNEIAVAPNSIVRQKSPVRTPRRSRPNLDWQSIAKDKRKLLIGGGVLCALVLLPSLFISLRTKDGTHADEFWKQNAGAFNSPQESKPVTDVGSREFQNWMNNVQSLPAEGQIEEVRKKLMELNPAFDGKLTDVWSPYPPKIKDGIVPLLAFVTDEVTDVSPIRAFAGLEILSCRGSVPGRGKLRNLSPLKGMRVSRI